MKKNLFIALLAVIVAGCSNSQTGVLQPNGARNQIIQGGQPPPNWETFSIAESQTNLDGITVGADGQMWMDGSGSVFRFDISTGKVTNTFSGIDTNLGSIATGPDGDLWMCGNNDVTKLAPTGQIMVYSTPDQCVSIVAGPDGAMWYSGTHAIGRMTTDGSLTDIPAPPHEQIHDVVVGSDGNIWAAEFGSRGTGGYPAVAKIDINTHAITEFKKTLHFDTGFLEIFADKQGKLYAITGTKVIYRLSPANAGWTKFAIGLGQPLKPGDMSGLYFAGDSGGVKWTFAGHKTVTYGLPPDSSGFPAYTAMTGPDHNVWFWNGPTLSIFINRVITVSPSSATLSVGQMQAFTISESGCPQCVWSAISSNPSIAGVSPVSSGTFTVTGISAGSATISVSDKVQNVFDVQITVK